MWRRHWELSGEAGADVPARLNRIAKLCRIGVWTPARNRDADVARAGCGGAGVPAGHCGGSAAWRTYRPARWVGRRAGGPAVVRAHRRGAAPSVPWSARSDSGRVARWDWAASQWAIMIIMIPP